METVTFLVRTMSDTVETDIQRVLTITTEILPAPEFYFAEDYHQQYLAKNPDGYCGLGGCGVSFSAS